MYPKGIIVKGVEKVHYVSVHFENYIQCKLCKKRFKKKEKHYHIIDNILVEIT